MPLINSRRPTFATIRHGDYTCRENNLSPSPLPSVLRQTIDTCEEVERKARKYLRNLLRTIDIAISLSMWMDIMGCSRNKEFEVDEEFDGMSLLEALFINEDDG